MAAIQTATRQLYPFRRQSPPESPPDGQQFQTIQTVATIGDRSDPSGITAATMTARIETRPPRPFRQSFGIQRRKNRFPPP
jgi:hypothetical protein